MHACTMVRPSVLRVLAPGALGDGPKTKKNNWSQEFPISIFSPPFPGARTLDPDTGNSRRIYFLDTRGGDTLKVTVVACPFRHRCQRVATDKTYLKMTVFPGR